MRPSRTQIATIYERVQRDLQSKYKVPRSLSLEDAVVIGILCGTASRGELDDFNYYCQHVQAVAANEHEDALDSPQKQVVSQQAPPLPPPSQFKTTEKKAQPFAERDNQYENSSSNNNHNSNEKYNDEYKYDNNYDDFAKAQVLQRQASMDSPTRALIQQMQAEEVRERARRLEQEIQTECEICAVSLYEDGMPLSVLDGCAHVFHEECFRQYLKSCLDTDRLQVKCPDEECKNQLVLDSYQDLIDKAQFERHKQLVFQNFIDMNNDAYSWCPTAGCKNVFILEGDQVRFLCDLCKKDYCLRCRVEFHREQTCKEFQISNKRDENDVKFEKFVKGAKFKQCTACKFFVEKNQGCDHMRCRCGYEFCYKCGGKFMHCECVAQAQRQQAERMEQARIKMLRRQQRVEQARLQKIAEREEKQRLKEEKQQQKQLSSGKKSARGNKGAVRTRARKFQEESDEED